MWLDTVRSWASAKDEDASMSLLVLSFMPMVILGFIGLFGWWLMNLTTRNAKRRAALLKTMGIVEESADKEKEKPVTVKGKAGKKAAKPVAGAGKRILVGFWHPYCNAGGGGERVLWSAIAWFQSQHPSVICLVYTGDYPNVSKADILDRVKTRFKLPIAASTIHFIPLPSRNMLDDGYFPRFTLIAQSIASMWLLLQGIGVFGKDGLWGDCFIDTMGYAFTYPILGLITRGAVPISAYVHYPTISTDMLGRVVSRQVGVENPVEVSGSWWKSWAKTLYYKIFIKIYGLTLLFSSHTMTNSSWTQAHVESLMSEGKSSFIGSFIIPPPPLLSVPKGKGKTAEKKPEVKDEVMCEVVYPPCDTREFLSCGKLDGRERTIVSLSQFRPEKAQGTQIRALHLLFLDHPEYKGLDEPELKVRLVIMGSSRGAEDEKRVEGLKALAKELEVQDYVEFIVNSPFPDLVKQLGKASIGVNTMVDEHFGINVVEFMAAGLIPLVHASAGPKLDIVTPRLGNPTGYHATTPETFAFAIHSILSLATSEQVKIRQNARKQAVEKFSLEEFEKGWGRGWEVIRRNIEKIRAEAEEGEEAGGEDDKKNR